MIVCWFRPIDLYPVLVSQAVVHVLTAVLVEENMAKHNRSWRVTLNAVHRDQ